MNDLMKSICLLWIWGTALWMLWEGDTATAIILIAVSMVMTERSE